MLAVEISEPGPNGALRPIEIPAPVPGPGEILIRIEAAGVARADLLQRLGKYPQPPGTTNIPGLDVAGTVAATGADAGKWKPGDRVCAILAGGGYAEFCAVPALQVLPIPQNWSSVEAATLPENLFTVFDNVVTRAQLQRGETILIHGGSSGIGSMAIMLTRAWGAIPLVTAGSDAKCTACAALGAEHAINYKTTDFLSEVKRLTAGRGVDVILDVVGGSYLEKNIHLLAMEGRLVIIGLMGGPKGTLDISTLLAKRGRVLASHMRARPPELKGLIAERLLEQVWPLLPAKDPIRPVIDRVFPLSDAALAHEYLESASHIGKVVLAVEQS
jgi:NADPH2:quinone reductase